MTQNTQIAAQLKAIVENFNKRYMVVNENGKTVVYQESKDIALNRFFYIMSTFADFRNAYMNDEVLISATRPTYKSKADVWLRHRDRRQFLGGIVYDPTKQNARSDQLNLWRGFAYDPKPGSWQRLHDHIRDVICQGNLEHFDFLRKTLARMIQLPGEPGEVAVIMRGDEGVGKGILGRAMVEIFGQHGFKISNAEHLVGRFNGHLKDCSLLFADEAFYAGDKKHIGILNAVITEDILTIEDKFGRAGQAKNCIHLIMASNEKWIVPASIGSRRYLVFDVPNTHKEDHAYFSAITTELKAGGYAAMLHDLQKEDLTGFNHRKPPVTEGLIAQRKLSMDTTHRWWSDCLSRGYVYEPVSEASGLRRWYHQMPMELLYASYLAFAKRESKPLSRDTLGDWFKNYICAPQTRPYNVIVGEDRDGLGATRTIERASCYAFGDLYLARAQFTEVSKLTFDWDPEAPADGEAKDESAKGTAPPDPVVTARKQAEKELSGQYPCAAENLKKRVDAIVAKMQPKGKKSKSADIVRINERRTPKFAASS
jgi:Family of unknown function (DUF5906)